MRHRRASLAMVAGWLCGTAVAAEPPPPIVVQPPPDTPVVVTPPNGPPVVVPPSNEPVVVQPVPQKSVPAPPRISTPAQRRKQRENRWFAPSQAAITAGGGVADFVSSTMRNSTQVGAQWDARVTIGTRSLLAFELGYAGTYNKLQSASEVAPYLVNNGFDGSLRLNILPFRVQPYVFAGVGYNNASVHNLQDSPAMAARFRSSDNQLLVPVGTGLSLYAFRHATFDARFTYRALFGDELDRVNPDVRLDQWVVTGRLGYAF